MTFEEVVDQALAMLQRRGRVTYRMLQRHFQLDDATLEDLKEELLYGQHVAGDEDGRGLVWIGEDPRAGQHGAGEGDGGALGGMGEPPAATLSASVRVPASDDRKARAPLSYT